MVKLGNKIGCLKVILVLCCFLSIETSNAQVVFVHGTYGNSEIWNDDIRASLREVFSTEIANDSIELFDWSGANNTGSRYLAADNLLKHISELQFNTKFDNQPLTIIGHSHGGNIILLASKRIRQYFKSDKVINIVTLNSPCVVGGAKLEDTSLPHYHIYSINDAVVPIGGFNKTGILNSGGAKLHIVKKDKGESSNSEDFETGVVGSTHRIFKSATKNIEYKDKYKFRGLKLLTHITGHRGWLYKNYRQWIPQLKEAIENNSN